MTATGVRSPARQRPAFRWSLAAAFSVLMVIGAVGSVVGNWSHNVLLDTDAWLETVGPIGTDPVVTDALAETAAMEINEFLDPVGRLTGRLPDRLDPLGEIVGGAIENMVVEETAAFFASDRYAELWLGLNETAHSAVVAVVRDQVPFISTAEGVVSVDLEPLLSPIIDRVIDRSERLGEAVPDFLLDVVEFDDALGQTIDDYRENGFPPKLNAVVIYESDRLASVQQSVALFDRLVVVLPIFSVVMAAAAVVAAPDRWLMAPALLIGAAVAWFASVVITDRILDNLISNITSENAAHVASVMLATVTASLDTLLIILLVVASVVGIGGLAGLALYRRRGTNHMSSEEE